uniref:Arrestin C-terminal-like domain-containing protein n=1 Tax=Meloidogyne incognita TaxID=6306 RepID=A0A914MGA2_MELIC
MEADLLVNAVNNINPSSEVRAGEVKTLKFEIRLPQRGLVTSLESKSVSVLYTIQLELMYRNNKSDEEIKAKTICGFTLVDCFDLARMPKFYFLPHVQNIVKKFGLFSCTGGQIRLHFSINRVAFVGGENIVIEGKIENRTDRRVDKVAARLQQLVEINMARDCKNSNLTDVNEIHEDSLALFVDPGSTLKFVRYFALPPLPPSSYALDGSDPETCYASATTEGNKFVTNRKISIEIINKCKRRNSAQQNISNEGNIENKERLINVTYQLCIFVTTDGVDALELNVPIIIGSLPQRKLRFIDAVPPLTDIQFGNQNTFKKAALEAASIFSANGEVKDFVEKPASMVLFMPNRKEVTVKLGQKFYGEDSKSDGYKYFCSDSQLNFTNKYPFYVNLPTSSKQSRKASIIANSVCAENSLRERQSTIHEENEEINIGENINNETTNLNLTQNAVNQIDKNNNDNTANEVNTIKDGTYWLQMLQVIAVHKCCKS